MLNFEMTYIFYILIEFPLTVFYMNVCMMGQVLRFSLQNMHGSIWNGICIYM